MRGAALRRLRDPRLYGVVARCPVVAVPENGVRPARQVKPGSHLDELHVADLLFVSISSSLPPFHLDAGPGDAIGRILRLSNLNDSEYENRRN